jgi:monofunctional biosynthetic peptidoglycan transglycosylase
MVKKASKTKPVKGKTSQRIFRKIFRILKIAILVFFVSTISVTVLYKWVNPPITPLMVQRVFGQIFDGSEVKMEKKWVDIEDISRNMQMSVIASEDNNFLKHPGIDVKAIKRAREANKTRKRKLGASTITQQTAKNVFLFPSRTYIRKAFELYFTGLIELIWGKERIMEVYLNVIEMGDGIYGVGAASEYYFDKPAAKLSKRQAATIAAILPNPRKYSAKNPGPYVRRRSAAIASLSGKLTRPDWLKNKK